jgi:CheY-like chemotaxis protein
MTTPIGIVVDDDPQVRLLHAEVLRRGGMKVFEATSASEALSLAQTLPLLDFVVTDLSMPDVDGVELCRQLSRLSMAGTLKIVVVSGDTKTQGDDATAAGCDVVLAKPCSPALLLATIRQLLKPS